MNKPSGRIASNGAAPTREFDLTRMHRERFAKLQRAMERDGIDARHL